MGVSDSEWVSGPELARRIGVSPQTVYKLARAKRLPGAVYIGRRLIINYPRFAAQAEQTAHDASSLSVSFL